ncbi:hypothetical protein LCGC14_0579240 [marine sediment metagenome]|uniref:Uncharacterized protein n=1 Tax=marine sediment metagenome TaxID=412755 RepID=A0A0F9RGT4_9ZZZZ
MATETKTFVKVKKSYKLQRMATQLVTIIYSEKDKEIKNRLEKISEDLEEMISDELEVERVAELAQF